MMDLHSYAEIILPLPLANTYTYIVPEQLKNQIVAGCLVLVPFGKNKKYTGVVAYLHQIPPQHTFEIKEIDAVENLQPVLRRPQLRFWEWISEYYLCKLGEVYKAALPSGFKLDEEHAYKPQIIPFIRLRKFYEEPENLYQAFDLVKKAKKQEQLLMTFIELSRTLSKGTEREVSKKELLSKIDLSSSVLDSLVEKQILEIYDKQISRFEQYEKEIKPSNLLNTFQQEAYRSIMLSLREKDVCLLHGVTSAGKTEIYIRMIEETLKLGRQALFLLPEIALTTQITHRLKKIFGDKLGVYHSKFSDNERVEIWNNLLNDEGYQVILGVRSSIFLPFRDLGLVIVDEEHEPSYKQQDPAPRYHARNAAIVLATMHGAKVVLGTATPSIESYYNAQIGKYGYVHLSKRFEEVELPEIIPVDIKELRRKKRMKSLFSPLLIEKMNGALQRSEQVILFQNRRGFAPMLSCVSCDWVPKCKECDVSLTYHKSKHHMSCHYCGKTYQIPKICPECSCEQFSDKGFGTEKVEEQISAIFPEVKTGRLDLDTVKTKNSHDHIILDFEKGNTRILIGTQMVSKGLDFGNVSLVGILNADNMMNFPDFRAHERAFQLMSQVSGRAGRRKERGTVILQTSNPEHPIIQSVVENDYEKMYQQQTEERLLFHYPPYYRIIDIILKHKKEETVRQLADKFAIILRKHLGDRVLGPDKPVIGRIQSLHIRKIMLKIEIAASLSTLRNIIEKSKEEIQMEPGFKSVILQFNVDPV